MGVCSLTVVKVLAVVCATRIAAVDRTNPWTWAGVRIERAAVLFGVVVVHAAGVTAGGPLERCLILIEAISCMHRFDVQAFGPLETSRTRRGFRGCLPRAETTHNLRIQHAKSLCFVFCDGWLSTMHNRANVDVNALCQERAARVADHVVAAIHFHLQLLCCSRSRGVLSC